MDKTYLYSSHVIFFLSFVFLIHRTLRWFYTLVYLPVSALRPHSKFCLGCSFLCMFAAEWELIFPKKIALQGGIHMIFFTLLCLQVPSGFLVEEQGIQEVTFEWSSPKPNSLVFYLKIKILKIMRYLFRLIDDCVGRYK